MSQPSVTHGTIVVERVYPATPDRVFGAYADVAARSTWGVPSTDDALVYSESDFRVGGRDLYRCGQRENLCYAGVVDYHDIVPDRRIVYTESVSDVSLLSVALVTWEVIPDGEVSRLIVTDQVASFVGPDMLEGTQAGTAAALDLLGAWLTDAQ